MFRPARFESPPPTSSERRAGRRRSVLSPVPSQVGCAGTMPGNWIAIRVTLLGGGGIDCDPPPGRTMIVGPRHTFADLATAVDQAFARWDLSHLHLFQLPDGRLLGPASPEWDQDVEDEASRRVASTVGLGERLTTYSTLGTIGATPARSRRPMSIRSTSTGSSLALPYRSGAGGGSPTSTAADRVRATAMRSGSFDG